MAEPQKQDAYARDGTPHRSMESQAGAREHITDADCWCHPTVAFVGPDGVKVYVHNDVDNNAAIQSIWPDARLIKPANRNEVN
jgi:hypothetical protein